MILPLHHLLHGLDGSAKCVTSSRSILIFKDDCGAGHLYTGEEKEGRGANPADSVRTACAHALKDFLLTLIPLPLFTQVAFECRLCSRHREPAGNKTDETPALGALPFL